MASIVVTAELPTLSIFVMQERVGVSSRCTVHAPQSAIPQPNFVPVMPNMSRSTHSSGGVAVDIGGVVYPIDFDRKGHGRLPYVNSPPQPAGEGKSPLHDPF